MQIVEADRYAFGLFSEPDRLSLGGSHEVRIFPGMKRQGGNHHHRQRLHHKPQQGRRAPLRRPAACPGFCGAEEGFRWRFIASILNRRAFHSVQVMALARLCLLREF